MFGRIKPLDAILATAGGDDVRGHLVVNAIIAVLIGLLPPPETRFPARGL